MMGEDVEKALVRSKEYLFRFRAVLDKGRTVMPYWTQNRFSREF
jgi:hypothetical protein